MLRTTSLRTGLLYLLLSVAFLKVCFDLTQMFLIEIHGAINPDAFIFLTVGRGMLQGAKAYVDVFESKPPGIFYLSALSLLLGGTGLLRVAELFSLFLIPAVLTFLGWRHSRLLALTSFCFGGTLAVWTQINGGGFETEIYTLIFANLYVLKIYGRTWPRILVNGFLMMMVMLFREPFLLGLLAASLLVSKSWKDLWYSFVLPVLIGMVMGGIVIVLLGDFPAFVHLYLPSMFGSRIQGGGMQPLFLRLLWINLFFNLLTTYSSAPLLGYTLGILWLLSIVSKLKLNLKGKILVPITAILGLLFIHEYFVLFEVFNKAGTIGLSMTDVLFDPSFVWITVAYVVGTLFYVGLLFHIYSPRIFLALFFGFWAMLCLSLSAGIGGYANQYLLFIVPAVIALYLLVMNTSEWFLFPFIVLVCMMSLTYKPNTIYPLSYYSDEVQRSRELDSLMDKCGFAEYALVAKVPPFAFSKYMPTGTLFAPYMHTYLGFDHPLYLQTYKSMGNVQILIEQDPVPKEPYPLPASLRSQFNAPVPDCAKGVVLKGFTLHFRKKMP